MGVFDDKKYEGLDWISQATEPIESNLNIILGLLPDEITIDYNTYVTQCSDYSGNLSTETILSTLVQEIISDQKLNDLGWDDKRLLLKQFTFEIDGDAIIDFANKTLMGNIKLIKLNSTLDEKDLKKVLGREGINSVSYLSVYEEQIPRLNEVLEVLGKCEEGLRSRSPRAKIRCMAKRLTQVFTTNEWNIKDTELANKVGFWITSYIKNANIAAFSNLCRLKVMTHKGQAIYSMEELA